MGSARREQNRVGGRAGRAQLPGPGVCRMRELQRSTPSRPLRSPIVKFGELLVVWRTERSGEWAPAPGVDGSSRARCAGARGTDKVQKRSGCLREYRVQTQHVRVCDTRCADRCAWPRNVCRGAGSRAAGRKGRKRTCTRSGWPESLVRIVKRGVAVRTTLMLNWLRTRQPIYAQTFDSA